MCKRGNYFIAMYDKDDNYIRDFNSIEECSLYFHTTKQVIRNYIFKGKLKNDNYKLFKIDECSPAINNLKSKGGII